MIEFKRILLAALAASVLIGCTASRATKDRRLRLVFTGISAFLPLESKELRVLMPLAGHARRAISEVPPPDDLIPGHVAYIKFPYAAYNANKSDCGPVIRSIQELHPDPQKRIEYGIYILKGSSLRIDQPDMPHNPPLDFGGLYSPDSEVALLTEICEAKHTDIAPAYLERTSSQDLAKVASSVMDLSHGTIGPWETDSSKQWKFKPAHETTHQETAKPLAQRIVLETKLRGKPFAIVLTALGIKDNPATCRLQFKQGGSDLYVWVGHETHAEAFQIPPFHNQIADTHFEIYHDLLKASHMAPHIPYGGQESGLRYNCPPLAFPRP